MNITEVRVFPVNEERLKAYATVTFDDCFVVRDLKVINGNSGLFVAMPSKKRKDGTFKDVAHPLNNDFRAVLEGAVLDAYDQSEAEAVTADADGESAQESDSVDAEASVESEQETQQTDESEQPTTHDEA